MSELPQGWTVAPLSELFEFKYGKGLPKETRINGQINVYGSNGVVGQHNLPITQGPTIIVGRKGSVGEVHLSQLPCWPIDTTYFIDQFLSDMPPQYWALFLKNLRLGQRDKSSAIPGISRGDIYKAEVPIPPLNEQRRIVAKLEALLSRVDACQQRLARIPVILKRFRQAVLAAACSGRLTADWREKNLPSPGAARHLLPKGEGMILPSDVPPLHEGEDRGEGEGLPEGWKVCSISDVGKVCNGSTPSRRCPEYWGGSIPWVSSGEVRNCIITEARESITQTGYDNSSVRLLPVGTVLLAMIGEGKTRGQTAILKIEATINQNIAAVIISKELITSEYLWHWFQFQYEITRQSGSGSGPQALNCQRVRELPLNLPPLTEQQEIVRRVEALFKQADQLEARYTTAQAQVDKLTQSILAKAFRGELVPQDPNDEPAEKLLERIREQREAVTTSQTQQKRGGKKQPGLSPSAPPDFAARINQRFAGLDADTLPIPDRQAVQQ